MNATELQAAVDSRTWFHRIKLPHGIVTPGTRDVEAAWNLYQLPRTLEAKNVLDIGAWEGGFSFEAERRGAKEVVAMDLWDNQHDPGSSGHGWENFQFCRRTIDSSVDFANGSVYELGQEARHMWDNPGRFDLVLFLEVLYHLQHPVLALQRIRSVLSDGGMCCLETWIDAEWISEPAMIFYPGAELNGDPTNWWGPNIKCVQSMAVAAGFTTCDLIHSHPDVHLGGRGKRACFHLR